ncbi:MAG: hypothetical protein NTW25_09925, partial [Candidatus Kapabacteria bacterium]|nr:hypothetical protein [Candidatus Kapabacteria bacterium]
MKKILIIVFIFHLFYKANSTPYMIPDIGAPGMNTYIEIIADNDPNVKFFGNDGFYLNNTSDKIHIVLQDPNDAKRVTFGPIIVSWGGRLISTQVFVNPDLSPPSWDHNVNGPAWSVNFSIFYDIGLLANSYNFKIVKPFSFPNNGDRVFGEGTLGKRSFKGAMIVDSLTLAPNATYTVSISDPDISFG